MSMAFQQSNFKRSTHQTAIAKQSLKFNPTVIREKVLPTYTTALPAEFIKIGLLNEKNDRILEIAMCTPVKVKNLYLNLAVNDQDVMAKFNEIRDVAVNAVNVAVAQEVKAFGVPATSAKDNVINREITPRMNQWAQGLQERWKGLEAIAAIKMNDTPCFLIKNGEAIINPAWRPDNRDDLLKEINQVEKNVMLNHSQTIPMDIIRAVFAEARELVRLLNIGMSVDSFQFKEKQNSLSQISSESFIQISTQNDSQSQFQNFDIAQQSAVFNAMVIENNICTNYVNSLNEILGFNGKPKAEINFLQFDMCTPINVKKLYQQLISISNKNDVITQFHDIQKEVKNITQKNIVSKVADELVLSVNMENAKMEYITVQSKNTSNQISGLSPFLVENAVDLEQWSSALQSWRHELLVLKLGENICFFQTADGNFSINQDWQSTDKIAALTILLNRLDQAKLSQSDTQFEEVRQKAFIAVTTALREISAQYAHQYIDTVITKQIEPKITQWEKSLQYLQQTYSEIADQNSTFFQIKNGLLVVNPAWQSDTIKEDMFLINLSQDLTTAKKKALDKLSVDTFARGIVEAAFVEALQLIKSIQQQVQQASHAYNASLQASLSGFVLTKYVPEDVMGLYCLLATKNQTASAQFTNLQKKAHNVAQQNNYQYSDPPFMKQWLQGLQNIEERLKAITIIDKTNFLCIENGNISINPQWNASDKKTVLNELKKNLDDLEKKQNKFVKIDLRVVQKVFEQVNALIKQQQVVINLLEQ